MKITHPRRPEDTKFSALFYGFTDSGKTYLLGTAEDCEETSPTLFINTDLGDTSLADHPKISVVSPTNFDELQEVYDYLREDNTKYRSVSFDGLTAQQREISMPTIMDEIDDEQTFKDLSSSKPPTQQNWLRNQFQMRKVIKAFRGLTRLDSKHRIHVFFTAGERLDDRRDLGVPALPGVLGAEVGGYLDVMARLVLSTDEDGKEVRHLYTTKHESEDDFAYLGKNRLRRLPNRMKNPTIGRIMEYWMGKRAKKS